MAKKQPNSKLGKDNLYLNDFLFFSFFAYFELETVNKTPYVKEYSKQVKHASKVHLSSS
jgi:hypothetical protein